MSFESPWISLGEALRSLMFLITEAMTEVFNLTGAMRSGWLFFVSPYARLVADLISPYRRGSERAGVA